MANIESEIKKLGLSNKEAKVYVAILKLGQAPAAEITVHSGINRATTYIVLEELKRKGLVSTFIKGKKTYFAIEPPERLKNLFEIEDRRIKESFSGLKNILPDLNKLYESRGKHPKIRLFEGKEGIDSLREDILKTKTKFLYQLLPLDVAQAPSSEKKLQDKKLKKLYNIPSKSIYCAQKNGVFPKKLGKAEYKFWSDEFETEIIIYGEKIAFINTKKKPIGVIVDDSAISLTMKVFFEALWKFLK
ncbi:MAG: hypothetical protein HYW79_00820 [Parcubacteria group bacterium]|nr:hypothetical protein [Parcubacteria group bacterium]